MTKTKNIAYWITTLLLCFFLSGGVAQFLQLPEVLAGSASLGYPNYFFSIIGFWKMMAIIAILLPRFPLVKEWAYAGIVFVMTGASLSHIAVKSEVFHIVMPLIIVATAAASWWLRPATRRV